jgi:hypothetical protein
LIRAFLSENKVISFVSQDKKTEFRKSGPKGGRETHSELFNGKIALLLAAYQVS